MSSTPGINSEDKTSGEVQNMLNQKLGIYQEELAEHHAELIQETEHLAQSIRNTPLILSDINQSDIENIDKLVEMYDKSGGFKFSWNRIKTELTKHWLSKGKQVI